MTQTLAGKKAVVTGAARGIGSAIAERFVVEGASVLLADVDEAGLASLANRIGQDGVRTDVSKRSDVDALFAKVADCWGTLDILVNNAGVTHAAELNDLTEEDFDRVLAINVKSAFLATQHAARLMMRGGSIINISSVNAVLAIPSQIPYAVSKGALKQLTNVTALALAPKGIRVNAIGPGTIATDMGRAIMKDDGMKERILSRTPLGRIGAAEEIASVAAFLAGDGASYITGQTIYAEGGRLGLNLTMPVPAGDV